MIITVKIYFSSAILDCFRSELVLLCMFQTNLIMGNCKKLIIETRQQSKVLSVIKIRGK